METFLNLVSDLPD